MSASQTLVSIVVPAYNHARFLPQAIDSVLAQTHADVELIVLDDGSTDETAKVLAGYGRKFFWETQTNMGQAATLNKGWSMARGEVLGYLSADDYLHPEAVQRALESLRSHPDAVAAYPDFVQVDEQSRPLRTIRAPEFSYEDMVLRGVCPPGPGTFFRRSAYRAAGGWDPRLRRIPDYEYWLRLSEQGPFVHIPEVLAYYRVHGAGQSFGAVGETQADELVAIIEAVVSRTRLDWLRARAGQARANALLFAARLHLMSGRWRTAIARAGAAFRTDPASLVRPMAWRLLASGLLWRLRIGVPG